MKSSKTVKVKPRAAASVKSAVAVQPAPQSHLWQYALGLFAAFCILYQVYSPALNGPFLLDDSYLPYRLPNFYLLPLRNWLGDVRQLLMFTYWLNFKASGNDSSYGYHVVNLALHFFNGAFIYLAVRKALSWVQATKFQQEALAIFAAGLFLFHPLQTESVSYVASRSETLSLFFVLAAYVVFLYRKSAGVGVGTTVAVLVLFAAATFSKEHTAVLPVLLLLTDYYWNPGFSFEGIRRNWKLYVPILIGAAAGVVVAFRILSVSASAGFGMKDLTWYQYFFTECRVIWDYVRMFLFPFGQNLDYDFPFSRGVLDHGAIIGLIALLAASVAAWIYRRRFPLASFGWFTFLLLLAPTSSFVPIRDPIAERRLYLPFIGLLFITVDLLRRWKTGKSTIVAVLGVVLAAEAVLAYQRNELWSNAIEIWKDTVAKSPNKIRPRFQLAYAYYETQHCAEAVEEYGKAAQLETPNFDLLMDWALAYDCAGNSGQAIDKFKQAASLKPGAHVYSMLGREYGKTGRYPEALAALATAEQLDPRFAMTYYTRGAVYESQGNKDSAIAEYRHALAFDSHLQPAYDALKRLGQ